MSILHSTETTSTNHCVVTQFRIYNTFIKSLLSREFVKWTAIEMHELVHLIRAEFQFVSGVNWPDKGAYQREGLARAFYFAQSAVSVRRSQHKSFVEV